MQQTRPVVSPTTVVAGAGLAFVALFAAALLTISSATPLEAWGTLTLAPALVLLSIPSLRRQAMREGDRAVFWFLLLALVLKLCGAVLRYSVAFTVYGGGDVNRYHEWGLAVSQQFAAGDFDTGFRLAGTGFVAILTGAVYTLIGPNKLGGFLVFSWLGFWGLFLFYRAFVHAVPDARRRTYGVLLFLLPSLVFWPSSIGKDSWMTFTIGLVAFGGARALSGAHVRGLATAIVGLWLAAIVRPHIAGLLAIALAAAYVMRRPRKELRHLAPLAKAVSLVVLSLVALVFMARADQFLVEKGIDTTSGVTSVLQQTTELTSKGGSEFAPAVIESPERMPLALVTVLFRPFVWEAHNVQAVMAGAEASFLLLLTLIRLRWVGAAVRRLRREPYAAFAFAYVLLFVVAFSGVANFGILARQRVQLLPLYLFLLSIPPVTRMARHAPGRPHAEPF